MKALVTGGGGFLGGAIVRMLLGRGDTVRSFARGSYPELEALGAEVIRGDLADAEAVDRAVAGVDVVFHVGAKAGVWGSYESFHQANVVGTEHILAACRKHGVRKLVYTSSPSVVFNGRDMEGVDESVPYADHYETHYPRTKAEAERKVLAANGPELATVALRPHLIWGPGDTNLVPRIVDRGKQGRLKRIGADRKLIDGTYVDNAAEAHLLAADRLDVGAPLAGKAYFIANGEPLPVWDMVNHILGAAGVPPVSQTVSPEVAYAAGWVLEQVHGLFNLPGEPMMTRFVAKELSTAHWFKLDAARRDFGYVPRVSVEEGLQRLRASFQAG